MESKPNIILAILDAVRADHLSCYGYHRKTSPNIDKIAKQGVLFEKAFSTAEWSPPSHASIFTGKYPSHHRTTGKDPFLKKENVTIAEVLNRNGYETIGITNNSLLVPECGFSRGFQKYIEMDTPFPSFRYFKESPKDCFRSLIYGGDRYTYRTIELVRRLLRRERAGRKPFFLFINFFNCHAPYNPPRPFKKRFYGSFNEPRFHVSESLSYRILKKTRERIDDPSLDIQRLQYIARDDGQFSFMARDLQVSEKEWEVVKSWYDGEISYLDHNLRILIDLLHDKEMFDNTMLIITSDHGENFGEHGLASHHFCLYDTLIHVPLIVTCPDLISKPRRIKNLASLVDIFPTILTVLGIKCRKNDMQGKSLYPFKDQEIHDFICAECGKSVVSTTVHRKIGPFESFRDKVKYLDKGFKCLRTKFYKYIISSDQREELYDLLNDPSEEVDISLEHPEKIEHFKRQLEETVDISFFGPEDFPHRKERREMLERLRKLGYI